MGFEFKDTSVHLTICGKDYQGAIDSPTFLDFWEGFKDEERKVKNSADVVKVTAECVAALLGAKAAKEIFTGHAASVTQYAELLAYIMGEIQAQGLADYLVDFTSTYSSHEII